MKAVTICCLLLVLSGGCRGRESRPSRSGSSAVRAALRGETAATRAEYRATWSALADYIEKEKDLTMADAVRAITRTVESHPVLPEVPELKPVGEEILGDYLDPEKEPKKWREEMAEALRSMAEGAR